MSKQKEEKNAFKRSSIHQPTSINKDGHSAPLPTARHSNPRATVKIHMDEAAKASINRRLEHKRNNAAELEKVIEEVNKEVIIKEYILMKADDDDHAHLSISRNNGA